MGFTTAFLKQTATHWAVTGVDKFNNPTFGTPEELNCRWEERTELIQTPDGQQKPSRARIFLEDDIVVGDYLFLGISSETDPRTVPNAYRILDFRKIPGLYVEQYERKAYL